MISALQRTILLFSIKWDLLLHKSGNKNVSMQHIFCKWHTIFLFVSKWPTCWKAWPYRLESWYFFSYFDQTFSCMALSSLHILFMVSFKLLKHIGCMLSNRQKRSKIHAEFCICTSIPQNSEKKNSCQTEPCSNWEKQKPLCPQRVTSRNHPGSGRADGSGLSPAGQARAMPPPTARGLPNDRHSVRQHCWGSTY